VLDPRPTSEVIDGKNPQQVRTFAKDLRVALWKKHFGLSKKKPGVGPPAATALASVLEQPAAPATIAAIQKRANANSAIYEQQFDWIPRNKDERRVNVVNESVTMGSSVWPGWTIKSKADAKQPWSDKFAYPSEMSALASRDSLEDGIQGYWCSYPYLWTQGQNNLSTHISLELLSSADPATSPAEAPMNAIGERTHVA
jgi:phospholipase D1/2